MILHKDRVLKTSPYKISQVFVESLIEHIHEIEKKKLVPNALFIMNFL